MVMTSDPYFNYSCRTGFGHLNALLLPFFPISRGAIQKLFNSISTNVLVLYLNAKKQVGRDFYLEAAAERIWCNEKMEKGTGGQRGRLWEEKGGVT